MNKDNLYRFRDTVSEHIPPKLKPNKFVELVDYVGTVGEIYSSYKNKQAKIGS